MPARIPQNPAAPATSHAPLEPTSSGASVRWPKLLPHVQRFAVWTGVALVGTYAMGSVVNHFFSGKLKTKDAEVGGAASGQTFSSSSYGRWWNPSGQDSQTSGNDRRSSDDAGGGASSGSISVIPRNTGVPIYSSTLTLTNLAPIGSNSSRQAYDVLGLRTSNTPLSVTNASAVVTSSSTVTGTPLVTFSLSGDMNLVPINNLEAGGLAMTPAALIPEPTTAAMVVVGLAGLAFTRRRQASRTA